MLCIRRSSSYSSNSSVTSSDDESMGQSTSQPRRLQSFEGKDLLDLEDEELQVLMTMRPLTKDEVLVVATSLSQSQPSSSRPGGFYSKEDDSPEADLAVRLNHLSKELAWLRFSTVPSRVKEPIFWESIFAILRERLVEHNAKFTNQRKHAQPSEEGHEEDVSTSTISNGYRHQKHHPVTPTKASSSFPDDENKISLREVHPHTLQGQLAAKDLQIADLERQIEALQAAFNAKPIGHEGRWVMDQDSKDFLSYPEEVKDNMRREKQKRLLQVQQDMKFILDSDEVADSNGHWECCGETSYKSTCPKRKQ